MRAQYMSPDENLAHKRAWGDMSTGGTRGIRGSVDYARKGAAVRAMLIEAAAQRWRVPVADKWYQAETVLAALPIVWDEGPSATVDSAQIGSLLKGGLDAKEAALGQKHGDVGAGLAGAAKVIARQCTPRRSSSTPRDAWAEPDIRVIHAQIWKHMA